MIETGWTFTAHGLETGTPGSTRDDISDRLIASLYFDWVPFPPAPLGPQTARSGIAWLRWRLPHWRFRLRWWWRSFEPRRRVSRAWSVLRHGDDW